MNLWRVAIDEDTGKVLGSPEAITTPASYAGHMSVSADGRSIAYGSFAESGRIQTLPFDPITATVTGSPSSVHSSSQSFTGATPSPDGAFLVFVSGGGFTHTTAPQLDIWISRSDGTALRQLTNDPEPDRTPKWSPDGKRIAFFSNRGGTYQVWSIKPDGSDLKKLTDAPGGMIGNHWSPDGSKMVTYTQYSATSAPPTFVVFDPRKPWHERTPQAVPMTISPDVVFIPDAWSPDGNLLAGESNQGGIILYVFATGQFTRITDSGFEAIWLNDNRRALYIDRVGRLRMVDIASKTSRDVFSTLPDMIEGPALSRDNRTLYFTRVSRQSDIWLMRLK
jgi:eukaryotic-like serine/threonine-protein kinase